MIVGLAGCQSTVVGPDGTDGPPGSVSFRADVGPLFAARCGGGCHVGGAASGVDLSTHARARASVGDQYGEPVIRPGDAEASPLVDKIEAGPRFGARMPQGQPPLAAAEIARVRSWIDDGAPDN